MFNDGFLDSIPDLKRESVFSRLHLFVDLLINEEKSIRELPRSFWVRKINGSKNIFKFRLNSGDRILFTYSSDANVSREGYDKTIVFLAFSNHDRQIIKAKNINSHNTSLYDINRKPFTQKQPIDINIEKKYSGFYLNLNNSITVVADDKSIADLIDNNDKDYLYYLNDEQYACVEESKPVLLSGSAGSGKTSVGIHKLLNIPAKYKTAYFTYSNSLLDNTRNIYDKYSDNSGENNYFFTTTDYLLLKSKTSRKDYVTFDRFRKWLQKNGVNKFPYVSAIDPIDLWAEINGIIKGFMGIDWIRGETTIDNLIARKTYIDLPDIYSIYDTKVRNNIYKFAKKYQEWLQNNNLFDENDLARKCINEIQLTNAQKVDYIIVDEVQDLSDLVIYFLYISVNDPSNILFSGDIHQIINPTYFSFGHLKNLFHVEKVPFQLVSLSKNYRSQKNIVDLANIMSSIRSQYIGRKSADYLESSIRTGDQLYFVDPKPSNLIDIVETINDRHYAAIIVASEDEKHKLQENLDHDNGRIFTIHDIKGLEYSYIVCYNLISNHNREWFDIFSGLAHKNARYRYYFNLFYVAITRARNNLLIYEDSINEDLLSHIETLFHREHSFDHEVLSLAKFSTPEEWLEEAQHLEEQEKYQRAIKAYHKALTIDTASNAIIRCKAKQFAKQGEYEHAVEEFMHIERESISDADSKLLLYFAEQTENQQTQIKAKLWLNSISPNELDSSLREEKLSITDIFDFDNMSGQDLKIFKSNYFEPKLTLYNETTLKADGLLRAIKKGRYGEN